MPATPLMPGGPDVSGNSGGWGGRQWGALAMGGLSALPFLFGHHNNDNQLNDVMKQLQTLSGEASATGKELKGQGQDALGPVLQYFKALASGDPNAVLSATQPERRRVVDQYDTARQTISQFTPRGGGANAALAQSRFSQGDALADITSRARTQGADQLANLSTTLQGLGLSSEQIAGADLGQVVQASLNKRGQDAQSHGGLGEVLGSLVGLLAFA